MKPVIINLKNIARNALFWICVCAALLFFIDHARYINIVETRNFHKSISNFVLANVTKALPLPLFLSVIVSSDIMRDKKNCFFDIVKISPFSLLRYYLCKVSVYLGIGMLLSFVLSYGFFILYYFKSDMMAGNDYGLLETVGHIFLRWLAYSIPSVLAYVSLSLFIMLLSGKAVVGIVFCILYSMLGTFLPILDQAYFSDYIYPVPDKIVYYLYWYKTRAPIDSIPVQGGLLYASVEEFKLAYIWSASMFTLLTAVGYFSMRKVR